MAKRNHIADSKPAPDSTELHSHTDSSGNRRRKENQETRQFIDRILNAHSHAIFTFDAEGQIRRANQKALELTGYSLEELLDNHFSVIFSIQSLPQTSKAFGLVSMHGKVISRQEAEITCKGGDTRSVLLNATPFYEEGMMVGIVGTLEDITDRKQTEDTLTEMNMYLNNILDNATEFAVAATDLDFRIIYYNPKAEELFGYTAEEVIGKTVQQMHTKEKVDPKRFEKAVENVRKYGEHRYNVKQELETGIRYLESRVAGISNAAGELFGFALFSLDVTGRKLMEEKIRASLDEKEVLLREIHHRVKNNLQLVMSLLELEAEKACEQAAKTALHESRGRIRSMSLVHEQLYQSSDLANINFSKYLNTLARSLQRTYDVGPSQTLLNMDLDDIHLGVNQAIPLGLLCNELITNIFEHAFPNNHPGNIELRLSSDGGSIVELLVSDNGIGIPDSVSWPNPGSMGLDLVCGLTKQINGEISLDRTCGTRICVRFRRNGYG